MGKDKTKALVLVVLMAVMLGVGAFQVVKMSSGPNPQPAKTDKPKDVAKKTDDTTNEIKNPSYADELPQRDPFSMRGAVAMTTPPTQPDVAKPAENPKPTQPISLPPLNPAANTPPPLTGMLPPAVDTASAPPVKIEPQFQVAGVIVGAQNAAVFICQDGRQKLVLQGGMLDAHTKVVLVQSHKVVLKSDGKTFIVSPGGNPNAK